MSRKNGLEENSQPSKNSLRRPVNASQRIAALFLDLLERQFPIDDSSRSVFLRSPSAFANQLNLHVNHLNRALKEATRKTTTKHISDRILQEAKRMLRHCDWKVTEISDALGFSEVTHFNNFFKKHVNTSPLKFRKFD